MTDPERAVVEAAKAMERDPSFTFNGTYQKVLEAVRRLSTATPEPAKPCVPCPSCGYVEGRPVKDCGHVGSDGCCVHPDNMTPECHDDACPLLAAPAPSLPREEA